jgi:hypothetical protein
MSLQYKLLAGLIVLVATAIGGYVTGKGDKEVVIQEKVVTKEGITKIVYKDRIVTVIKEIKPDGTVTETTKTEEKDKVVDKTDKETDSSKDSTTTPAAPRYSLGLYAINSDITREPLSKDTALDKSKYNVGVSAGINVFNPIWLKFGYVPTVKQVSVGLELQL